MGVGPLPPGGLCSQGGDIAGCHCYVYWYIRRYRSRPKLGKEGYQNQIDTMGNQNTKTASANAGGNLKTNLEIVADLKSQLCQQHSSDKDGVYFRDGVPEDKASAIFTDGSRFFALKSKTDCTSAGGDPEKWTRLRDTRDMYLAGRKFAPHADKVMFGE